jgi:perosamine synthetase
VGAEPIFVDVDPNTLLIDLDKAEESISRYTKAIMVVHYAGNPINIDKLYYLAKKYDLAVIEDAAHACGASYDNHNIGHFGLTCFSFQAVKNLPVGDGGMIVTNDEEQYKQIRSLTWMGIDRTTYDRSKTPYKWEYAVTSLGHKYHSNDIIACLGSQGLKELAVWNDRRAQIVQLYKGGIPWAEFLDTTPNSTSANHLCVIKVDDRNKVHDKLLVAGIETGVHYTPNYYYPMYRSIPLPETEKVYERILSLPLHTRLTDEDVERVCSELNRIVV